MNRGRRWKKNEKKRNRRTQCKETERKKKLGQRRGRNHTSSKTKNDPKPTHTPPSSPERPAVSQTSFSLAETKEPSRRSEESARGRDENSPQPRHKTHGLIKGKIARALSQSTVLTVYVYSVEGHTFYLYCNWQVSFII